MKTYRDKIFDKTEIVMDGISSDVFAFRSIVKRHFLIGFDTFEILGTFVHVFAFRLSGVEVTLEIRD